MKPWTRPRLIAGAILLTAVIAIPATAQPFRYPYPPPVYARVTLTNQTDLAVVFHSRWGDEPLRENLLDPGRSMTLEATFPPGTPKPELTVEYRPRPGARPDVFSLPSGHVDPATDNPG